MWRITSSLLLFLIVSDLSAQRPVIKFGDIKPSDFSPKVYPIDSNANAVVLSDIGSSKYEGDNKGGFSIIFKRHTRIHILNRNAFDVATISIPLYASGSLEERIESLEASTYNLENGSVEVTKLDKSSIFKDRLNKNFTVRKFTMPNLKEGCIIEIKYSLNSPYERDLHSWQFQGEYPELWSQYAATVPSVYDFAVIKQGYQPYKINRSESGRETYNILEPGSASQSSNVFSFTTGTSINTWAMENVPALKKEIFTSTLDNHIAKIDFQLSKIRYPEQPVKEVMSNWMMAAEELMKDPDFGEGLSKSNNWLDNEVKKITASAQNRLDIAKKIYDYVRDNFTCTNHNRKYLSNPLKKTFQSKSGNVADINLLLTAMLLQQGFEAHPVMLSTRDNGKAHEVYPIMDRLNYVVSQVTVDDKYYLLDASYSKLGFGKLSSDCYNGYARVIDKMPVLIDLNADSLKEEKITNVFIINDEKQGLAGSFQSSLGYEESYNLREKLVKTSKEDLFKDIKKSYGFDVEINNINIDSLKVYEEPVTIKYDFKFGADEDIIYLNPTFTEGYRENPFKAAERYYPVEMPYAVNETYLLNMEIPKGYKVEEVPKSTRVKFNEDEGMFEYIIAASGGYIQLRSKLKMNKATFLPEDYQSLRDFYGYVVKKQSEQIVLKKIK